MSDNPQTASTEGAAATGADAPAAKKFKTVFINRLQMEAVIPGARGDQPATLSWACYRGNPRIVVRTNDPADSEINFGKIEAAMDLATFEDLAATIIFGTTQEPGWKQKLINKSLYKNKQRFDKPEPVNSTLIGKDSDGRMWISIVEDNRPAPRFFFGNSKFHQVIRADGTPLPDNEASCHMARATMNALKGVMQSLAARAALGDEEGGDDNAVKTGGGGQASQGGGWKGGGGGGWQNRQGGGGWQGRQGGGGGWKGNGGGQGGWNRGGGGWNRGGGNGGGGGGGYQKQEAAAAGLSNDDITF